MFDDHDRDIVEMRDEIVTMWKDCGSKRERRSLASSGVPGFGFFGDNIGNLNFFYFTSFSIVSSFDHYSIHVFFVFNFS